MGYHARKSKGRRSGSIQHTEMDLKRVGWCLRNDIAVMVSPNWDGPETEWLVEIRINGKKYLITLMIIISLLIWINIV